MTIISEPVRFRYEEVYRKWQLLQYPAAVKQGGFLSTKYPDTRTANGLTTFCCNFLKWSGNHGERTNNLGRPIQKYAPKMNLFSGKVVNIPIGFEWQKGSGITGTSDIKGHINATQPFPIPVYIEVKIGRDKQSNEQKDYEHLVTSTGALYCLVKVPDDFILFYDHCRLL